MILPSFFKRDSTIRALFTLTRLCVLQKAPPCEVCFFLVGPLFCAELPFFGGVAKCLPQEVDPLSISTTHKITLKTYTPSRSRASQSPAQPGGNFGLRTLCTLNVGCDLGGVGPAAAGAAGDDVTAATLNGAAEVRALGCGLMMVSCNVMGLVMLWDL